VPQTLTKSPLPQVRIRSKDGFKEA
jgi:hypothetical protein